MEIVDLINEYPINEARFSCILRSGLLFAFLLFVAQGSIAQITFKDATSTAGLTRTHVTTEEIRYIVETISGGVAVLDCNDDGLRDIATVNGSSVETFKKGGTQFVTLYKQRAKSKPNTPEFEDISAKAGLTKRGWGMGLTAVDIDNDGKTDLFATGFKGNAVFKGMGNCMFKDVTAGSGLEGEGFQTGAAWVDHDRDGDLDVFVTGYVSLDLDNLPVFGSSAKTCSYRGIRVQCGPRGIPGERDFFYLNEGGGKFREVSKKVGLFDSDKYYGLGAVWGDYDNDGYPDLFVANDSSPNYFYRNKRDGTFEDMSFESGVSYSGEGGEQGSMGVTFEDFDRDGDPDLFVTNFESENNTLYENRNTDGFLDVSTVLKIGQPAKPYVGWGTSFVDFDNNGWLDVLVVNGHVYSQMEFVKTEKVLGYKQQFLVHQNMQGKGFVDVTAQSGLQSLALKSRRGAAFADFNNDGNVDVVVTNLGEKPTLLMNAAANKNRRILVELRQSGKNSFAIGAKLTVFAGDVKMSREVKAGDSYLSQNDLRLHFGLNSEKKIDKFEVRWPDGKTESFAGIVTNSIVLIERGKTPRISKKLD